MATKSRRYIQRTKAKLHTETRSLRILSLWPTSDARQGLCASDTGFSDVTIDSMQHSTSQIHRDAFNNLGELLHLYIHANPLATIEGGTFDGLTGLQTMTLGGDISANPDGLFQNVRQLLKIGIFGNKLSCDDIKAQLPKSAVCRDGFDMDDGRSGFYNEFHFDHWWGAS